MLFGVMLAGVFLVRVMPKRSGPRAVFTVAYVVMHRARLFCCGRCQPRRGQSSAISSALIWHGAVVPFWLAGGFDGRPPRSLWAIAVGIETIAPMAGFWVPGLGRSSTADWNIEGAHMAERCGLFMIIALGESVVITGAHLAGPDLERRRRGAFVVPSPAASRCGWFISTSAPSAASASRRIRRSRAASAARLTYLHILIVAGIIVAAVGDELVCTIPAAAPRSKTAAVVLGGPALFLDRQWMFKRLRPTCRCRTWSALDCWRC